jgi:hypothetical protein
MSLKSTYGKKSTFLRELSSGNIKKRKSLRVSMPSSTKVGAGTHYVHRSNPSHIMRKANHRSNATVPINAN